MGAKHTPGPWIQDGTEIANSEGVHIGCAYGFAQGEELLYTPESYANARLMSTAPELLKRNARLLVISMILLVANLLLVLELRQSHALFSQVQADFAKENAAFAKEDAAFQSLARSADTLLKQNAKVWEMEHEWEAASDELIRLHDPNVSRIMLPHLQKVEALAKQGREITKP